VRIATAPLVPFLTSANGTSNCIDWRGYRRPPASREHTLILSTALRMRSGCRCEQKN